MNDKIPLIHTLESDMNDFAQSTTSPVMAAQQQLENRLIPDMTGGTSKWKVLLRIALILLVLIIVGSVAYKITTNKTDAPTANTNQTPSKTVTAAKPAFDVRNVWPSMGDILGGSTGEATGTDAFVVISINDFNTVYDRVTNNEDKISEIATQYFGINSLSKFSTQSINNFDLHIADGGDKPLVYGYIGQKYLVFTTSITDWLKINEKLGVNVNKSS